MQQLPVNVKSTMSDLGSHRCHNCHMAFRSFSLLEKHREKFCIGSQIGDPTVLSSRYPGMAAHPRLSAAREFPPMAETPDFQTRDSIARLRAKENLLNEREQRLMGEYGAQPGNLTDSRALMSLTEEFHKLRKSLEVSVPTLRSVQLQHGLSSHWDREYRERILEMTEAHERHLADIQARNQALEDGNQGTHRVTKRGPALSYPMFTLVTSEDIAGSLAYVQSGGNDAVVLAQMRDLQAEALTFEEISYKQDRKEKKKKRNDGAPRTLDVELMAVELENQRLEEEIFNLKLHRSRKKIENGDSEIAELQREHLQQMSQLQADIEMLKRDVTRMPPRGGHGPPPFQPPPLAPPLPPPVHPSGQPLGRPQPTIAMGGLESMRPPSPSTNRHLLEPLDALGPAPYDPVAGFVIFYDFILGLEPTFQKVRLMSGLYGNGHRMGQPSTLPDALCEVWNSSQHLANNPRGNIAMLRAKQPIPRVRPSASISLVMEFQVAGGFNTYGQEVQHMSPSGWTKLDLFDQHNQVLSGRWKLPVRALPLRPGLSTGQLNTVPQVGTAELYLRIINARDADLQSMAEIDPRNSLLYSYPPLILRRIRKMEISGGHMPGPAAAPIDNPAPQPAHQQPPSSFHLALSPYTDYVDPPPVQELPNQPKPSQRDEGAGEKGIKKEPGAGTRVGFIIDRVTEAPPGDGTLRLTGYHMNTGQAILGDLNV
ncbi:unnamed protein product [Ranitomeya imitator]|uniref:Coiled-coil domain-containing protein 17 n=1 Tax=Ranitomeya imitator TaxID=111125 RepID=A0ABN9M4S3_9NEOB|nr:unnamed protein product [Ranitomeya imitator]